MMTYDYIIVGAGLAGLTLARRLKAQHQTVLLLEKSRGAGGRLCTRRWDEPAVFFDHGCAGLPSDQVVKDWIDEFSLGELLFEKGSGFEFSGFEFSGFENRWFVKGGVSKLGRVLSEGLELERQVKVSEITTHEEGYKLSSEEGDIYFANQVIITAPVPQARDLLRRLVGADDIPVVAYQKRICLLASVDKLGPLEGQLHINIEGHSALNTSLRYEFSEPAVMLTSSSDWAEERYEEEKEQLQISLKTVLEKHGIGPVKQTQLHKWRYAIASVVESSGFSAFKNSTIFMAGDAFSGGGVAGAITSANKLSKYLFDTI